jgi:hypothetical protein
LYCEINKENYRREKGDGPNLSGPNLKYYPYIVSTITMKVASLAKLRQLRRRIEEPNKLMRWLEKPKEMLDRSR